MAFGTDTAAGKLLEANREIDHLRAENTRLRNALPSAAVRDAISDLITHDGDYADAVARVRAWLDSQNTTPVRDTPKARRIRATLEASGHTVIRVWWEPIGIAMEMCGPSGGWMAETATGLWPLGYCEVEAREYATSNAIRR